MDYYSHTRDGRRHLERLARLEPATLAFMHGSAWREWREAAAGAGGRAGG